MSIGTKGREREREYKGGAMRHESRTSGTATKHIGDKGKAGRGHTSGLQGNSAMHTIIERGRSRDPLPTYTVTGHFRHTETVQVDHTLRRCVEERAREVCTRA